MPDLSNYRRLTQLPGDARREGYVQDPCQKARRPRDAAALGEIPAILENGRWYYHKKLVHEIAETLGMIRADDAA